MGKVYSMTLKYLDSKRISGTTADREGIPAVAGGWKEIGRTTLGSAANFLTVSSLPDKRYYMVLFDQVSRSGAANNDLIHFNTDTANNYARRYSANGGTDGTSVSRLGIELYGNSTNNAFYTGYIANLAGKEKLAQIQLNAGGSTGAGNASTRVEIVGKWANTSDAISEIKWKINNSTETFGTNSEIVVLGWDDSDTHTTNFWEELATNSTVSSDKIDVSFTAKKYLWVQGAGTSGSVRLRVGNTTVDTGSNYTERYEQDGGADATLTSQSELYKTITTGSGAVGLLGYINMFIINDAANEKLIISNVIENNSAGAGTAPRRLQTVAKWANTSNQIDIISLYRNSETLDSGNLTVWGSN